VLSGPAIIDEPTTTVVIPPGWRVTLDDQRNFHLQRAEEAA
jgi:N-methylhydantoinase A